MEGNFHEKTKTFVASISEKLELFYLPPYSPDLNPDELVWNHLKTNTVGRSTVTDKANFKKQVTRSMKSLQKNKNIANKDKFLNMNLNYSVLS